MRLDQLQRYMSQHGLAHAIALHMNYRHLDWISKDTDMQASHWQKHSLSWAVPEGAFDFDNWAIDIAQKLMAEEAYIIYNPIVDPEDKQGVIMIYGFRYHQNPQAESGWNVVFEYTYIDPDLALM